MTSASVAGRLDCHAEVTSGRRKKVTDEREARRCLAAGERAGLTAGEWARERGIDGRSLHAWQMNVERRGTSAGPRRRKRKAATKRALVELVPAAHSVN